MKDQLRQVEELGRLDVKRDAVLAELERLPARRAELESALQEARTSAENQKAGLAGAEKKKRDLEGTLEMAEARLKEFQGKLNQIKTNKEYQAALKEVAETKKENKTTEDQILQLMAEIEGLKKGAEEAEKLFQGGQTEMEKEMEELVKREQGLSAEAAVLETQRREITAQIEPSVLSLYERVKKLRPDAVARVSGSTCQGCHMHIPPQLTIEIRKSRALYTCPSCHRILCLEEEAA